MILSNSSDSAADALALAAQYRQHDLKARGRTMLFTGAVLFSELTVIILFLALPVLIYRRGRPKLASWSVLLPVIASLAIAGYTLAHPIGGQINWLLAGSSTMLSLALLALMKDYFDTIRKKNPFTALADVGTYLKIVIFFLACAALAGWLKSLGAPEVVVYFVAIALFIALIRIVPSTDHIVRLLGSDAKAAVPAPQSKTLKDGYREISESAEATRVESKIAKEEKKIELGGDVESILNTWSEKKLLFVGAPLAILNISILVLIWPKPITILTGAEAIGLGSLLGIALILVWDEKNFRHKPVRRVVREVFFWGAGLAFLYFWKAAS